MEITEINMISDFEAGMKCLQNPSLLTRFSSGLSVIGKVPQVYSFWKWGALILLAIFATFTSVINKIKLLIIRVRIRSLVSSAQASAQQLDDDDFDFSDDDISSSETASDDDEIESTSSFEDQDPVDEDFSVAGSSGCWKERWQNGNCKLRRRNPFSWSDFSAGKSVVQLWDSFGLNLDFEEDSYESKVSLWDLDRDVKMSTIFGARGQIPAVTSSPAVVLSAEVNENDGFVLGAYDTRVGRKIPGISAEWRPRQGKVVGIDSGGVEKVYVMDGVTGALTICDMRSVKTPLENLTESGGDIWLDANAGVVKDE